MNAFQQLLSDYQNYRQTGAGLLAGWQPAAAKAVKVERTEQELDSQALQQALQEAGPAQGWLLCASERLVFDNEPIPAVSHRILAADLYVAGHSLRIRELTANTWLLASTQIQECDAGQASQLAIAISHLSAENNIKKLTYQQLWCHNVQGRLHIEDAVFTGFEGA